MLTIDRLFYLLARGLSRLTRNRVRLVRYRFVAQPVPEKTTASPSRSRFTIRRACTVDGVLAKAPRARMVLERRLRNGAVCVVAECDGRFGGFIWLAECRYEEDEVRCLYALDPQAGAAWDFDVYVAPEYRATRLFQQLWDAANDVLRERGHRWTFSRISAFNTPSLAAHRRLGAYELGRATFLIIGRMQLTHLSIGPRVHVSLRESSYPVVRLSSGD